MEAATPESVRASPSEGRTLRPRRIPKLAGLLNAYLERANTATRLAAID